MMGQGFKGRLERWNAAKGFGFIRPEQGREDIFIHISQIKKAGRKPAVGDMVSYQIGTGRGGKPMAVNASIIAAPTGPGHLAGTAKASVKKPYWAMALVLLLITVAGLVAYDRFYPPPSVESIATAPLGSNVVSSQDAVLKAAFENQLSNLQIEGKGVVVKLLPDDNDGSRHQKFIIRLNSGQTLMVAHNIELAPRVDSVQEGDDIEFFGEYEWNPKGGVIHWTHRDPGGSHLAGWLKHKGKVYQ